MRTKIRRLQTATIAIVVCAAWVVPTSITRAQAAATPSTPTSFRVQVTGQGRPMILIPGLMSSGDTWTSTVARYQGRFRCHVLTLAGFAGVPPITQPLLATVRTELVAYIRAQRLGRPVIVGHSLGGTLALALAADHPDLAGSLVIVDSLPFLAGAQLRAKTLDDARAGIAAMRAYMANQTPEQFQAYIQAGTATEYMVTGASDHDRIKAWGLGSDQRTAADALADLMSIDVRQDAAKIASPTLVLGTWIGLHEQLKKYGVALSRADVIQTFEQQFANLPKLHFHHHGHRQALHHVRRPGVVLRRARPVSRQPGISSSAREALKNDTARPGRPYWICQAAGWGGFLAYVLGGYLLTNHPKTASDVVSIVFFNGVVCPAATHGLRHWTVHARLAPAFQPASVRSARRSGRRLRGRPDRGGRARAGSRRPVS